MSQKNKYGYQQGKFQPKDFTNVQWHYCGEFDHVQVKCREFKKDLQQMEWMIGKSKSTHSTNVVNDGDDMWDFWWRGNMLFWGGYLPKSHID